MENLHNLNNVQSALMAARMRTDVLRKDAELYEQVSYRFFPPSKYKFTVCLVFLLTKVKLVVWTLKNIHIFTW